jgi:hypothetical protein
MLIQEYPQYVAVEVLMAGTMKNTIFWDVNPSSSVEVCWASNKQMAS